MANALLPVGTGTFTLVVWIAAVAVGAGLPGVRAFGSGGCDAPCLCCVVFGPGSKPSCGTASGKCTCNGCSCRTTPGGSFCGGEASLEASALPLPPAPAVVGGSIRAAAAAGCEMTGAPWVIHTKTMQNNLYPVVPTGADTFNISFHIRHGVAGGEGKVDGNSITLVGDHNLTCTGTFDSTCNIINWTSPSAKDRGCFSPSWCRAWTPGCASPAPPYGEGFSFMSTLGSNMVLQQAPAKAAVYGIVVGKPTAVKVTVTDATGAAGSYEVDATFNTTHQPFGPEFVGGEGGYPGPFQTWKAYLDPTKAGGNYTISAVCTGCTEDGTFSSINISNVAFGDVWHCSGQSNMWLPVGNAFGINETLGNISAGKYNNIRVMAGNSGSGTTNPWMTAVQASVVPPHQGRGASAHPPLLDFGAACWYFAEQLSKLGVSYPIGLSDTAIGGQRIEEYMVNDTTLRACSDRAGEASPEWNGRLYGEQTIPFVDMTVKGWVWYQGENNMGGVKGNSAANVGYGCEQKALVDGWRKVWSETPGTTDPLAPFGIVTLASSGSEGGPDMGASVSADPVASHPSCAENLHEDTIGMLRP